MMKHKPNKLNWTMSLFLIAALLFPMQTASASPGITTADLTGQTAADLVNTLLGPSSGAVVSNITFSGSNIAAGTFSGGTGILGFESGVILSSGNVADVAGPNDLDNTTTSLGTPGDSDLGSLIPGYTTFDATVLEFDFECPGIDVVSFNYVFASEEYNEYVNSPYNNVFGFFLNGANIALLPDGVTPVAINNVNGGNPLGTGASNPAYYINNDLSDGGGAIDIEADGLTVVLGAQGALNPGVNHIKLAISDAGDSILDSWVFLKGGSFACAPLSGIFPPTVTAELPPGGAIDEVKTVYVPPRPPKADVVFSFDLTGSMGGIINTAKAQAGAITTALDGLSGVDINYGVMSYMDYPSSYSFCGYSSTYGSAASGDYAYNLDQAITADPSTVIAAINGLSLGNGADGPQDYTRIFYESYSDPAVSWRSGAKRIHLNFGDNVPHDCDLNEGVPGTSGSWSTGCDPGRDALAGTGDDLDLQTVLAEMSANGITLLEAHTTSYYNNYWAYWTGLTGGSVYLTGSSTLVDDILAAVQAALEAPVVYGLHLEAEAGYESWLVYVNPDSVDVTPGTSGAIVTFDITIQVPAGTTPGVYQFTISALDADGVNYGDQEVTITVVNQPPVVAADNASVAVNEGDTAVNSGTVSDPDGDIVSLTASVGTVTNNGDGTWSWSYPTTDGPTESQTVTISADDGNGGTAAVSFDLTVNNVAPTVSIDSVSPTLVAIGGTVDAAGSFTDPGTADTHTAGWEWGDGSPVDPGAVTQGAGFGSVTGSHIYSTAGIYTIKLTVTDDDGGVGDAIFQYVVVYDPSAGFVTGGGWINSPAGAYTPDPTLEGKANFGFVSKYKKGATVPEGQTEFQFHVADLNFHSSSYEWLVVTGSDYARFKGAGTINGVGAPNGEDYKFMIWAGDDAPDTFRIRIWWEVDGEENAVYDNLMDQPIAGGSIVIHAK